MPQSQYRNYLHIVFSTKYRQRLITENIEQELFSYLGGICKNLDCNPIQVGGYQNHVHILCLLAKNITLEKLLQVVKSNSSKWMKTNGKEFSNFYWQDGYAAFSVNPYQLQIVQKYIQNQKAHHTKKDFKTELVGFLNKYKIEYDEKYVWD